MTLIQRLAAVLALTCLVLPASTATAESLDHPSPRSVKAADGDDVQHQWSVTLSPVHLILPVLEVAAEYRLQDKIGIGGLLGGGQIKVKDLVSDDDITFLVLDAGGSFRYYVLGTFIHGMQLGTELSYTYVSTSDTYDDISAVAGGLSAAGFVGYKIATNVGFTFEIQGGAQYMILDASAKSQSTGDKAKASDSKAGPLLNLQLGWSF